MSFFSPEKVDDLIPVLTPLVEELWRLRRELAITLLEEDPVLRRVRSGPRGSTTEHRATAQRVSNVHAELIRVIGRIETYGCIVKDLDLGLLDFPALRGGKRVFLCWKAGEAAVTHWHGTDESFAERKLL